MAWTAGPSRSSSRSYADRLVSRSPGLLIWCIRRSELLSPLGHWRTLVDDEGLTKAVIGDVEIPTKYGSYVAGEHVRGCASWRPEERDRCTNFAAKAVAAGLHQREVELAEKLAHHQAAQLAGVVRAILERLELSTSSGRSRRRSCVRSWKRRRAEFPLGPIR
jgi:hypothetical protein